MPEPFLAEIRLFAGNFAPKGWAFCNGQLLPINQHHALFALLGSTYGGDGRTNFALPDLRGRAPIHIGVGPGLTPVHLGETGGTERVTLSQLQLSQGTGPTAPAVPGGQSFDNRSPFLGVNYIIALEGIFPSPG